MNRASIAVVAIMLAGGLHARAENAITNELKRDLHDAASLAAAPVHWRAKQWTRFGEGLAAAGVVYAADSHLYDAVQRNRSSSTNNFAKFITPFGGQRALDISALMWLGGALAHSNTTRDAGHDSLEAEFWAAGVVTPILKRAFGRARPSQGEGARSFHRWTNSAHFESFPSGHATNAFAFATAIAGHYDNWVVPTIVYSIASGVAVSRVNDRAHFPSDVLAGALIGRVVAKGIVGRHLHVAPAVVNGKLGLAVRFVPRS